SQMSNPRAFFSTLGEQVAQQVAALTPQLLAPADPSEPYLRRVGRENAARSQAEEIALNDLIFDWGPEEEPEEEIDEAGQAALEFHQALMEAKNEADQIDP